MLIKSRRDFLKIGLKSAAALGAAGALGKLGQIGIPKGMLDLFPFARYLHQTHR